MPPLPPQHQIWRCSQRNQPAHTCSATWPTLIFACMQLCGRAPHLLSYGVAVSLGQFEEVQALKGTETKAPRTAVCCDNFPSDSDALTDAQTFINSCGLV